MRQPDFMSPGSLSQHPISEVYSAGHLSLRSFLVFAGWRGQTGNIDASGLHTVSFAASLSCDVFVCLQHDAEPMSPPVSSSMARSQSGPPDSPGYEPRAHHMLSCTAYAVSRADYEREAAAEAAAHSATGAAGAAGAAAASPSRPSHERSSSATSESAVAACRCWRACCWRTVTALAWHASCA